MQKLLLDMLKNREGVKVDTIMAFCEDMLRYLENEIEEECETNQHYVRMKELFHGLVIIDQLNADLNCMKYKKINEILAHRCVKYYNDCQKDRNNIMHDENKQKKRIKGWFEKEK